VEAFLRVVTGASAGASYALRPGRRRILGSGPGADVRLAGAGVAPEHAAVRLGLPGGVEVVDLGSPAGTHLNGRRLAPRQPALVRSGDELTVGPVVLEVELTGDSQSTKFDRSLARQVQGERRDVAALVPGDAYEVTGDLGRGAMGSVLAARRRSDDRAVAIKVLRESIPPGSPGYRRFEREARVGARIDSPYVVRVLDLLDVAGRALIVMELVAGPSSLQAAERRGGALTLAGALTVGEHVTRALAAATAVGVVHRDVKPQNVLLDPSGRARLTDFGIAKDLDERAASLTASGQGLGTLAYMAPECVRSAKHASPAADLYSLGATVYRLLAGEPPFRVRNVGELLQTLEAEPEPLGRRYPGLPPAAGDLVAALLRKDPRARPASAEAVAGELAAVREAHCPGAAPGW